MVSQIFYIIYAIRFQIPWDPTKKIGRAYIGFEVVDVVGSFVSQSLIAYIMFRLATKVSKQDLMDASDRFFPEVEIEAMDE